MKKEKADDTGATAANESNEESENESDRNQKNNDSSEDGSDFSSDFDEKECEYRRSFCIDTGTILERYFVMLKDQLYVERTTQIDQLYQAIHTGDSDSYLMPLHKLEEETMTKIKIAGYLKDIRLINIQHLCEAEQRAAKQNMEEERVLAYESLNESLSEQLRQLEEDRNNIELVWSESSVAQSRSKTKTSAKSKPVTVTGPYVVYNLDEKDILEDWTIIRRSLKTSLTVI